MSKLYRMLSDHEGPLDAQYVVKKFKEVVQIPFNFVMTFPDTGEIAYIMTGKLPIRKYNAF